MAVFICQGCGQEHSSWGGKCPNCGTSETIRLSPATDRMVDRVIKGKYKIVRKLEPGDLVIMNNQTWTHAANNWSPGSGVRRIGVAIA